MLPVSDHIPARRFPFVNVVLIVANFAVWIFYELPHLNSATFDASLYPCAVNGSCHGPERWGVSSFTAMSCTTAGTGWWESLTFQLPSWLRGGRLSAAIDTSSEDRLTSVLGPVDRVVLPARLLLLLERTGTRP